MITVSEMTTVQELGEGMVGEISRQAFPKKWERRRDAAAEFHIACITESWLNDNTPSDSLYMDGYSFYRCDRKDGCRGGGIVCYVSSYLDIQLLSEFESEAVESLWLLFRGQRMPRLV